ncbi:MAG: hypothetical protein UU46_C0004G0036 [Candidatus Uhrbacteria bacterium GW2011_GWD1_41_16]|nr:MAG: hypothetical protein UU46_C0004G0036 [Candidatus Uhrbacteria bacterium GW2011_GWD1_41_16]
MRLRANIHHVEDVAGAGLVLVDEGVAVDLGHPQVEPEHRAVREDDEGGAVEVPRRDGVGLVEAVAVCVAVPGHQTFAGRGISPAGAITLADAHLGHLGRGIADDRAVDLHEIRQVAVDREGCGVVAVVHDLHGDLAGGLVDRTIAVVVHAVVTDLD